MLLSQRDIGRGLGTYIFTSQEYKHMSSKDIALPKNVRTDSVVFDIFCQINVLG